MDNLINGKLIAKKIIKKTKRKVKLVYKKGIIPKIAIILVGKDKPSLIYVRKKIKTAKKIGIKTKLYHFKNGVSEKTLGNKLKKIQTNKDFTGIIIQLPLPKHINCKNIINKIDPDLDIECLTEKNLGKLILGTSDFLPPAPGAIMEILKNAKINLKGTPVTMVGTGLLIGRPLSAILINKGATVFACNKDTQNLKKICLQSKIIISAAGKKGIIKSDMVTKRSIVIDAGVSFKKGKIYGDADPKIYKKVKFFTPTPGGVGPITVAKLLQNAVLFAEKNHP